MTPGPFDPHPRAPHARAPRPLHPPGAARRAIATSSRARSGLSRRRRQTALTQPQVGSALGSLLGLALVLGLLAAVAWLLISPGGDGGPAGAVGGVGGGAPDMQLPGMPVTQTERLAPDEFADELATGDELATAQAIADMLALNDYARREIPGRLVMRDGGRPPEALALYARTWRPDPEVRRISMQTLGDQMSEGQRGLSLGDTSDLITRATRIEADADGSFVMPNFPLDGAFIQVESELVYQPEPLRYAGDEDELLVLLTRAAVIEGTVRRPDGSPLAGATAKGINRVDPYAFLDEGMLVVELARVEADEQGLFRMAPVPVGISLKLHVGDREGALQSALVEVPELAPGERWQVEVTLVAGCTLAGRVLDEQDAPVQGLTVHLQPASINLSRLDELGRVANDEQETDSAGAFAFTGLPDGAYLIMLGSTDYLLTRSERLEVSGGEQRDDILLLAELGATLRGRVLDADGEPITSALIRAAAPPSFMSMRASTERGLRPQVPVDEQGRFSFSGYEPEKVRVWATAPGFVNTHLDAQAGGEEIVLEMQRETAISGIAMSLVDGEPLTEYTLRATPSGGLFSMSAMLEMEERMTNRIAPLHVRDALGRFSMPAVPPGTYDLHVSAKGFARASQLEVEVLPSEGARGVIFMVQEAASVVGTVISSRSGLPLAEATVSTGRTDMMSAWTDAFEGGKLSARSDTEGRFELSGLGTEPVSLSVSHRTHQPLTMEKLALRPGQQLDVGLVRLSTGGAIWGRVTDERGRPEPGVSIMAAEATGKSMRRDSTDEQGMYRVEGLAPGSYSVIRMDFSMSMDSDSAAGFMQDMLFETASLAADEELRVDLSKVREGGTRLAGLVSSAAGPEADAVVWIVRETGGTATRFGSTNAVGEYHFDNLQPGRWLLQVLPSGETFGGGGQPSSPVIEPVVIGGQPSQRLDVDVPGGVLRGLVLAAQGGELLENVRVVLERTDDGRPSSRFMDALGGRVGEAWSNARGEFQFQHLPTGSYTVIAGGQNIVGLGQAGWGTRRVENISVSDGSVGLTLKVELEPGGAISGRVSDSRGKHLSGVPVWGRNDATGQWLANLAEVSTDGTGSYSLNSLGAGSWTLALGGETHALTLVSGIIVNAGSEATRDVTLKDGVEVFVDPGPYDPYELLPLVLGPDGRLPTQLVSMNQLLGAGAQAGHIRVGRVLPGAYELSVLRGSEVVHQANIKLSGGEPRLTIVLGQDP
ncbi:MAG: hypothetical protein DRQ55_14390 [Planctomycetota bacterium]|nr:MAG: hypothetical protein DRQ55_14390 [Planctomycetota bacterium]